MILEETSYAQGLTWPDYLKQMTVNRQRILRVLDAIRPTEAEIQAVCEAVEGHVAPLSFLILTEDWCGDAVVNVPVVVRLAEALPNVRLRLFVRSQHAELQDMYAAEGVLHIPVISIFDGNGQEVARFVEQTPEVRAYKEAWLARFPEASAWRTSTDPAERRRWQRLMIRLLQELIEQYESGWWHTVWNFLLEALRRNPSKRRNLERRS